MAQTISIGEAAEILAEYGKATPKLLRRVAGLVVADVRRDAMLNVSNDLLRVRTGQLRRYISVALAGVLETPTSLGIGLPKGETEAKIARLHDTGTSTPIRPVTHRNLRIPMPEAMTSNRVDREPNRHFCTDPYYQGSKIFFKLSKTGLPMLWASRGKGKKAEIVALYLLVPEVTLPARFWFTGAVKRARGEVPKHARVALGEMRRTVRGGR